MIPKNIQAFHAVNHAVRPQDYFPVIGSPRFQAQINRWGPNCYQTTSDNGTPYKYTVAGLADTVRDCEQFDWDMYFAARV